MARATAGSTGSPAVVTRKVGRGSITYVGGWFDDATLAQLTGSLLSESGAQPLLPNVPRGVELCVRSGKGHAVMIFINHNTAPVSVAVPAGARDLLGTGGNLPAYGVAVFEAPSAMQ